jgi:hypothetical protein
MCCALYFAHYVTNGLGLFVTWSTRKSDARCPRVQSHAYGRSHNSSVTAPKIFIEISTPILHVFTYDGKWQGSRKDESSRAT